MSPSMISGKASAIFNSTAAAVAMWSKIFGLRPAPGRAPPCPFFVPISINPPKSSGPVGEESHLAGEGDTGPEPDGRPIATRATRPAGGPLRGPDQLRGAG